MIVERAVGGDRLGPAARVSLLQAAASHRLTEAIADDPLDLSVLKRGYFAPLLALVAAALHNAEAFGRAVWQTPRRTSCRDSCVRSESRAAAPLRRVFR